MIKLLRYLKLKDWIYFLISLVFIVAQVYLDLKLPDYMSEITTLVETSGSQMGDIWSAGGMIAAVLAGKPRVLNNRMLPCCPHRCQIFKIPQSRNVQQGRELFS